MVCFGQECQLPGDMSTLHLFNPSEGKRHMVSDPCQWLLCFLVRSSFISIFTTIFQATVAEVDCQVMVFFFLSFLYNKIVSTLLDTSSFLPFLKVEEAQLPTMSWIWVTL